MYIPIILGRAQSWQTHSCCAVGGLPYVSAAETDPAVWWGRWGRKRGGEQQVCGPFCPNGALIDHSPTWQHPAGCLTDPEPQLTPLASCSIPDLPREHHDSTAKRQSYREERWDLSAFINITSLSGSSCSGNKWHGMIFIKTPATGYILILRTPYLRFIVSRYILLSITELWIENTVKCGSWKIRIDGWAAFSPQIYGNEFSTYNKMAVKTVRSVNKVCPVAALLYFLWHKCVKKSQNPNYMILWIVVSYTKKKPFLELC